MDIITQEIALTFKDYMGKPDKDDKAQELIAMAGRYDTKTTDLLGIIRHNALMGKMIAPSAFDQNRFEADKAVGLARSHTARTRAYFVSTQLIVVDIDDMPVGESIRADITTVLDAYKLRGKVAAIYPSSNYGKNGKAKLHMLFVLDKPITDRWEYAELYYALVAHLGINADDAMAKVTQPLYGTVFKQPALKGQIVTNDMIYRDFEAVIGLDWVRSLPKVKTVERKVTKARTQKVKGSQQPTTPNAPTTEQERQTLDALTFILNYEMEQGGKALHQTKWMGIVWAALAGATPERVIDLIEEHPIWGANWSESNKANELASLVDQYRMGYPTYTTAYLAHMAVQRGWIPPKPVELGLVDNPDGYYTEDQIEAGDINLLHRTVHLIAPMGSGKSGYAKALIQQSARNTLDIVVVPRVSLIAQQVEDYRSTVSKEVFHYSEDGVMAKMEAERMRGKSSGILITTPNSLHRFSKVIGRADIGVVSLEEYGQGVGMWTMMNEGVEGFEILESIIQRAAYVVVPDGTEPKHIRQWVDNVRGLPSVVATIEPRHKKKGVTFVQGSEAEGLGLIMSNITKRLGYVAAAFDNKNQLGTLLSQIRHYNTTTDSPITYVVAADTKGGKVGSVKLTEEELQNSKRMLECPDDAAPEFDVTLFTSKMGTGVSILSVELQDMFLVAGSTLSAVDQVQMMNRFRRRKRNRVIWTTTENNINPETVDFRTQMIASTTGLASLYREGMNVKNDSATDHLNQHIEQDQLWTAYQHEHGLRMLQAMMERDGMRFAGAGFVEGVEPLERRVTRMTDEELAAMAERMGTINPIPPNPRDRTEDYSSMSLEDVELGVLRWRLYSQFAPNMVNSNLLGCLRDMGKRENSHEALTNLGYAMGADNQLKQRALAQREAREINQRQAETQRQWDRVQLGSHVIRFLSPDAMEANKQGAFVMHPSVWEERAKLFWEWITQPDNAAMYDRSVGRDDRKIGAYLGKEVDEAAYSVMRQIGILNGIVVSKIQKMVGGKRVYVPVLEGLNARWTIAHGRAAWNETHEALKSGIVPKDIVIPAFDVDWSTLGSELLLQVREVRELVDRKSNEKFAAYKAFLADGYPDEEAMKNALAGLTPQMMPMAF